MNKREALTMHKQRMIRKLAWAAMAGAMLALSSCNAPGNSADDATPDSEAPASQAAAERPAAPAALPAAPATLPAQAAPSIATALASPRTGDPVAAPSSPVSGPQGKPGLPPLSLGVGADRACRTDSDCAMKDAGSCCGYRPVCVNKDTPTFPEKVKAACANDGRVGICGFPAIDGCQCVAGKCAGVPMMENSMPLQ